MATVEVVVVNTTIDVIVARTAKNGVVIIFAVKDIITSPAVDEIFSIIGLRVCSVRFLTRVAGNWFGTEAAIDRIVTVAPLEDIGPVAADDEVIAVPAFYGVVINSSVDEVVPVTP